MTNYPVIFIFFGLWAAEWLRFCWKKGVKRFIIGCFVGSLYPLMYLTFIWFVIASAMVLINFFALVDSKNIILPDLFLYWLKVTSTSSLLFILVVITWLRYKIAKDVLEYVEKKKW